eukprot:maker-scaffold_4-snap-gene-12.4-mRNA-1 protein AED:0.36 eAED:0.36 QI:40/1/1/1/0/0/3/93/89
MGKGSNVNKKRAAQAAHAKKMQKEKVGGGGKAGQQKRAGNSQENVICTICKVKFPTFKARGQIQTHFDSKHSKSNLETCFPGITEAWGL